MNISVNNEQTIIPDNLFLSDLIEKLNLSQKKGIAAAINNSVIPKNIWNLTLLKENDNILIIKATQGG